MSWIVERLIIDAGSIRNNEEIDSDLYLDLISLDEKVQYLHSKELISDIEMGVLMHMMEGYSISATAKDLKLSRTTTSLIFKNVCTRIAFHLGGSFTDEGYLDYIKEKYLLSNEQIQKAKKFITGRYRHSFMRRNL